MNFICTVGPQGCEGFAVDVLQNPTCKWFLLYFLNWGFPINICTVSIYFPHLFSQENPLGTQHSPTPFATSSTSSLHIVFPAILIAVIFIFIHRNHRMFGVGQDLKYHLFLSTSPGHSNPTNHFLKQQQQPAMAFLIFAYLILLSFA